MQDILDAAEQILEVVADGSTEAFLRRLWHDLYGDESIDMPSGHAR
jgi:hypothetical protein